MSAAVGIDFSDVCVIEFVDDILRPCFKRYLVNDDTVATSQVGQSMMHFGHSVENPDWRPK
jgi:hypothetical protein